VAALISACSLSFFFLAAAQWYYLWS